MQGLKSGTVSKQKKLKLHNLEDCEQPESRCVDKLRSAFLAFLLPQTRYC